MKAFALILAALATPAAAQEMDHAGHDMAGMKHDMPGMHHAAPVAVSGVSDEVGAAEPPPIATDHPADRFFSASRMASSRAALSDEGRFATFALSVPQLEYRAVKGGDGYGWKAQGWYGSETLRLAVTTEGEGRFGHAPERAEASMLLRQAVNPWFDVELGLRHDFQPDARRTYAVLGIDGLAPYWIELEGQLLISSHGDAHLRISASHDARLTQRLILQPSVEINAGFQSVPQAKLGAGVERIEASLRLRYALTPQFAPYVGLHWERKWGATADYLRVSGEPASTVSAVVGLGFAF